MAESILFSKHAAQESQLDQDGFTVIATEVNPTNSNDERRHLGAQFAEDADWSGWSADEHEESLKWLLQPGDVLHLTSACTTWSYGQMVLVPNTALPQALSKLPSFFFDFKTEPDFSRVSSKN
ncbi:hypothetical protein BdWA1_000814 [Babesia duncani]|uniref:Uncharacterized protein n=1 Tax=Babesia duncani TaxID=323732 RepID=A0AAD9PNH6_9APIC|nr:hypothetical protein BdWA1_000814 [Babesia duncani]